MNESDTRLKLIDPALKQSWELNQIRTEYYFTDGEIVVRDEHRAVSVRKGRRGGAHDSEVRNHVSRGENSRWEAREVVSR